MEINQIKRIKCGLTLAEINNFINDQTRELFFEWSGKVKDNPTSFKEVEREILKFGNGIACLLTAGILADRKTNDRIKEDAEEIRKSSGKAWRYVSQRCLTLTLLCGLTLSLGNRHEITFPFLISELPSFNGSSK